MENFELIDDYVRGRLEGDDKEAFEKQLNADPSLKDEVALQKQLIEGIKKVRMTELKAMLNQVPVTGAMQTGAGMTTAGQIAIGAITSVVLITGTLFYFKAWENIVATPEVKIEKPLTETPAPKNDTSESATTVTKSEDKSAVKETKKKEIKKKAKASATKGIRPNIQVVDPTDELTSAPAKEEKARTQKESADLSTSRIEVETDDSNSKYSFHYQFNQDKLVLFGKFDKGLYEIIEVNGTSHSVFMYYKDNYYLINEKQTEITPLIPIKDAQLIRKLKEYRKG